MDKPAETAAAAKPCNEICVSELDIPTRTAKALAACGLFNAEQIATWPVCDIKKIRGIGADGVRFLILALNARGISMVGVKDSDLALRVKWTPRPSPPARCAFCGQPARSPRQRTCRACHAKSAKAYRARRRAEIAAALGLATAEDFTANG